jgi:phage gpG-like protein
MEIKITQSGIDKLRARFTNLTFKLSNPREALQRIAVEILDMAVYRINQSGPDWAPPKRPLKPAGRKIMILTGTLRNSLVSSNTEAIAFPNDYTVSAGTNVAYAKFQQGGTSFIPARRFLYADQQMQADFRQIVVEWLAQGPGPTRKETL